MSQSHHLYVREAPPTFLAGEDPCQRLASHGAEALHSAELMAVVLGGRPQVATQLLATVPLEQLMAAPVKELTDRFTPRQASRLVAAFELARRGLQQGLGILPTISCPAEAVPLLAEIKDQRREHFLCLYLNARNQVIHKEVDRPPGIGPLRK